MKVILVTLVEGDDEGHVPTLGGQAEEAQGIVGGIQGSGLDRQVEGFAAVVERDQAEDAVVAVAVSHGDDQG